MHDTAEISSTWQNRDASERGCKKGGGKGKGVHLNGAGQGRGREGEGGGELSNRRIPSEKQSAWRVGEEVKGLEGSISLPHS